MTRTRRAALSVLIAGLSLSSTPGTAAAQGCSQCRDQVAQTSERAQAAYRKGIVVLVFAGTSVFLGALVALRRAS